MGTQTNDEQQMVERLRRVLGDRSHREIGLRTGFHPETVRRWRNSGKPAWTFLAALIRNDGVPAHWIMTGETQVTTTEQTQHHLQAVPTEEILDELARRIDRSDVAEADVVILKQDVLRKLHPRHERALRT